MRSHIRIEGFTHGRHSAAFLADGKQGFLDSASPGMLLGGGIGLLVLGVIVLLVARRIGEDSDAGGLLNMGGWVLGVIGILGIYQALFGS